MSHQIVFVANDNVVEVSELKDGIQDIFLNAATVQLTVEDEAGAEVAGQVWPAAMTYVVASNGVYRVVLSKDAALQKDTDYVAVITIDGGPSLFGTWRTPLRARERR